MNVAVKMWPTPQKIQRGDCPSERNRNTPTLASAVKLWPTASARDWKDSPGMSREGVNPDGSRRERTDQLARAVYATPQSRDFRTGQRERWQDPERSQNLNDQVGGLLNPNWVEWLMGYPPGWTDLKD